MQQIDLEHKTRASAERAAINEAKQKILFKWHRKHRPMEYDVFCYAENYPIYCKAVTELNDQYNSTNFTLTSTTKR